MIIVTGGAGFIGSVLVKALNKKGYKDIIIVDNLGMSNKWKNLAGTSFLSYINKDEFLDNIDPLFMKNIDTIFHLGACTDTGQLDAEYLMKNNFDYSLQLLNIALDNNIRFIYASSAATYGNGSNGFSDEHSNISNLVPTNAYAFSKQQFDLYLLNSKLINDVIGLKLFNVFGPNEYHKDKMRSVINKSFHCMKNENCIKLFKGSQSFSRDFIYVKDVIDVLLYIFENMNFPKDIYNLGTGIDSTWKQVAIAVSKSMGYEKAIIQDIPFPEKYMKHYQKKTKAEISKLRQAGYSKEFTGLEDAIKDYIKCYLEDERYF